jgi:hypothetical protein
MVLGFVRWIERSDDIAAIDGRGLPFGIRCDVRVAKKSVVTELELRLMMCEDEWCLAGMLHDDHVLSM